MDWQLELLYMGRIALAAALGGLIGWEREDAGREAGIRTFAAVAFGACAFSLVSSHVPGADPTRIAAQIVTGIGFIGAGVIVHTRGRVSGLTTAATVWASAAVGMACGYGMYVVAVLTSVLLFGTLFINRSILWKRLKRSAPAAQKADE